jgi:pyruvate/2-oxoglutarate dehydrogenase complex dihydrolipoamide acyltransferase (E2) component
LKSKFQNYPNRFPKPSFWIGKKNPGDAVHEGDVLMSVETDKIVLEVYAPCDELRNTHKTVGNSVTSSELLASIDDSAKPTSEPIKSTTTTKKRSSLHD